MIEPGGWQMFLEANSTGTATTQSGFSLRRGMEAMAKEERFVAELMLQGAR